MGNKIKTFEDLLCWQEAKNLALIIYSVTGKFPNEEKFCLVSQMRRSAISVSSNIAEGFSRRTSKDKVYFYTVAKGSAVELRSQVIIAKELGFMEEKDYYSIEELVEKLGRLLTCLIRGAPDKS